MSYLLPEPQTYINIKLTDDGRRMLSLGQLNFSKAILSDREINYGIDPTNVYNILCSNRILSPKDVEPVLPLNNYDGSAPLPFQSIGSAKQISSAMTNSTGFFTGATNNWGIDSTKTLGYSVISYSSSTPNGGTSIQIGGGDYFPNPGDLMFVPWQPIQNSGHTNSGTLIYSANPTVALWYRVLSTNTGTSVVSVDRNLPNFGPTISTTQSVNAYFYPFNGIANYYGSASTVDVQVWNMNIVRTSSVIGTDVTISGYTSYGSIEYNGTKQFLGFSAQTRDIGIIHYTNNYSGNTYAEQLIEGTVIVDLPYIMWHNSSASAGQGKVWGLSLNDSVGSTYYDSVAGTTYRLLTDGYSTTSLVVGRVYHKLKIIVITDIELLTALTYKSNRNFTLPPLLLGTSSVPNYPLSVSNTTGLLNTGYSYYVTYIIGANLQNTSGVSFGYPQEINCNYISRIDGVNDSSGHPQYLRVNFSGNSLPFMRNGINMGASSPFSGTGWAANKVQIMVNKINTTTYPNMQIDDLPTDNWTLISNELAGGNGIFSGGSSAIDPSTLLSNTFIITQQDFNSGSTYVLNGQYSAFTMNTDTTQDGITFGDESFFFGNITAGIMATTFKSILTVAVPDTALNTTVNPSFDSLYDSDIYITEIGIIDNSNTLVGVGKPTSPIKKNASRYLVFQLEIDF